LEPVNIDHTDQSATGLAWFYRGEIVSKLEKEDPGASEQLFRSIFENAQIVISLYRAADLLTNPTTSELGDGNGT
jgi:hypothetical protein